MAILTNSEGFGDTGVSQKKLIEHILHLESLVLSQAAKMDADGGITDTDYAARAQQVIASGAVPLSQNFSYTTIKAEYDA